MYLQAFLMKELIESLSFTVKMKLYNIFVSSQIYKKKKKSRVMKHQFHAHISGFHDHLSTTHQSSLKVSLYLIEI